ncbi:MAG: DegT/DnrJ/EryC1/StrS family aminotransferase [Candidatus Promineifilaceae bacterium]
MNQEMMIFEKDLSAPDPIPAAGIERAVKLMKNGRIHRYGEAKGDELDVVELEREYAAYMGIDYCVGLNSCGCALFIALKTVGVKPGDKVLVNAFTLAPVPGAIAHCNAQPVLVEVNDDYLIDLADLRQKAATSGAKVLMISHMRGHIADMDAVVEICAEHGIALVEDCAHTMGATWDGRKMGTFGDVSCFSTQTFKHINSGEGGLLVTNNADIAAQAILYSGSYMLYHQHGARPEEAVFAKWKGVIPNFSMRMTNFAAAVLRPQIPLIDDRGVLWNKQYDWLAAHFAEIPHVVLPERDPREGYVASSIQFNLVALSAEKMLTFQANCKARGVFLKWFGGEEAVGFTSSHHNWEYMQESAELPQTDRVMRGLFDMRIPLSLTEADAAQIGTIMHESMLATVR